MSYCKVTLLGNVGRDPEMRYTAQEMAVAQFSVATSRKAKGDDKKTSWHNCTAFGKTAELIQMLVKKGTRIFLDGTIDYNTVEGEDGKKITYTKIIVNEFHVLNGKEEEAPTVAQSRERLRAVAVPGDDGIPF